MKSKNAMKCKNCGRKINRTEYPIKCYNCGSINMECEECGSVFLKSKNRINKKKKVKELLLKGERFYISHNKTTLFKKAYETHHPKKKGILIREFKCPSCGAKIKEEKKFSKTLENIKSEMKGRAFNFGVNWNSHKIINTNKEKNEKHSTLIRKGFIYKEGPLSYDESRELKANVKRYECRDCGKEFYYNKEQGTTIPSELELPRLEKGLEHLTLEEGKVDLQKETLDDNKIVILLFVIFILFHILIAT